MVDVVSTETRSAMMAGIKGRNTKPELQVRKALHAGGFRFRLHRKELPGCPDIVMPGRKVAIFVHGCFWHAHHGCRLAKVPSTRSEFWKEKLGRNAARDQAAVQTLQRQGWRVLVVWECFLRQQKELPDITAALSEWLHKGSEVGVLAAQQLPPLPPV